MSGGVDDSTALRTYIEIGTRPSSEVRIVLWGPNNWDAWRLHTPPEDDWESFPEQALRSAAERIPGRRGLTVADLGCVDGRLVPFLADRYSQVVAVDYAPASLAEARKRQPAENVQYRRRDMRDLTPFREAFDVAVAVQSIVGPRRADVDRILRQVWRSLREGGLLLALFPAADRVGEPVPLPARSGRGEDVYVRTTVVADICSSSSAKDSGHKQTWRVRFPAGWCKVF